MATVTPPPLAGRVEPDRRVAHPLQRLRSSIRLYVALEGLAVLALYLALWFWIGLLLDYGFFKVFQVDWVQELPRSVRVGILCVLLAGLAAVVILKMVLRLLREFRDPALALVLERRFPDLLGDRLITAVELADPRLAEEYGYSQAMVARTVREASERVEQLSIREVFDWDRLRRLGVGVGLLTAGVYLLVAAAYCASHRTANVTEFTWRFNDVAVIWFERNVLLADTIWPRRAYLELLDFPGEEIRVGRDAAAPTLRVRAIKWVIADLNRHRAPDGWRALTWADLTPDLLGEPVPHAALPEPWRDWTVDRIEMQLDKPEGRDALEGDHLVALRRVLGILDERAASSRFSRRLRRLEIPVNVEVLYRGATTSSEQTMPPGVDHEFSGTVSDLRESLRFTVRGEDYYTPYRRIIVVPPPGIVDLTVDEEHPAYLYHRVPLDGNANDLKGKKQVFLNRPVSLMGEKSTIQVPAGANLLLRARTDKPLVDGGVRFVPHKPAAPEIKGTIEQTDAQAFQTRFTSVTAPIEFAFEFTDTDHVRGRRHVEIKPVHDTPPEVDVQVEVIRKVNQSYMVTPVAKVPFSGKVRDDRGLTELEYVYTVERAEVESTLATRLAVVAGSAGSSAGGPTESLLSLALLGQVSRQGPIESGDKSARSIPLFTFERAFREQSLRPFPAARLEEMLKKPPQGSLLREFELEPDLEVFDVAKLGVKVADDNAQQPRYRMRLWVVATDNNVETGPRTGQSKEKFPFLIVHENELLAEIAKEEEALHHKLEEALGRLRDGKIKLDKVAQELPDLKPEEFSPMARRAEEVDETVLKGWDVAREVFNDYRRILRELEANLVSPGRRSLVKDKIVEPLDLAIREEGDFFRSDESLKALAKRLDDKQPDAKALQLAQQQLQALIDRLNGVLDAMGDVTSLNRLIIALVQIEKGEREEHDRLKELLRKQQEKILEGLEGPAKKEP